MTRTVTLKRALLGASFSVLLLSLATVSTAQPFALGDATAAEWGSSESTLVLAASRAAAADRWNDATRDAIETTAARTSMHEPATAGFTPAFAGSQRNAMTEEDDDADDGGNRRWRRWLKRRWYIPALAAVAVGVALASDDDDGPNDD